MDRILFLDFDGVLNSRPYFFENEGAVTYYGMGIPLGALPLEQERKAFDPKAVERLNRIIEASGAKIVCSTAWRRAHDLVGLQDLLALVGVKGEVIDTTPVLDNFPRSVEILAWLEQNTSPERSWVILDDLEMHGLQDKHVHTSFERGLQDEHVEEALRILGVAQT